METSERIIYSWIKIFKAISTHARFPYYIELLKVVKCISKFVAFSG